MNSTTTRRALFIPFSSDCEVSRQLSPSHNFYSPNRNRNIVFHAISSRPSKRLILPKILGLAIIALMSHDNMPEFVKPGEERGESCRRWYLPFQSSAAPLGAFLVILYPSLMFDRFLP